MDSTIKIAVIVPSMKKKGPVIVAHDIIANLDDDFLVEVFYFDPSSSSMLFSNSTHLKSIRYAYFKKFDIIHSHGLRPDMLNFYLKVRYPHLKSITTNHNFVFEDLRGTHGKLKSLFFGYLWVLLGRNKDKIVTLTQAQKLYYAKYYKNKRFAVIGNGRDIATKLSENYELQRSIDDFKSRFKGYTHLGTTCLLIKRKGVDQVLHAMVQLEKCTFLVVGDGPDMGKLIALAKTLKVYDRCLFAGFHEDNSEFFKSIDIFLLTSYSEAFPLALVEASLHGVKSVCSDLPTIHGVLPKHLVHLYTLNNISMLVKAIQSAQNAPHELSEGIHNYAQKELTAATMAVKYAKLYKQLNTSEI